ncbi:unnamed protein product [Schistosoma turkestanicum]|nr:unnamed protein product [Schistosoma turkestanicum]
MSYLNKYVKLHDDQFAMSIWDGDLILTQLDLRLEFLEDIIPFPVNFRSGRVHELRIHVPWTKLNSECIVITLNTVECIFGLKKPDLNNGGRNKQDPTGFIDLYACKNQSIPTNVPPGYLEVYIYRLLSNIHFVVHNLNLKFIEEDLVLSLSLNKADCFATDFNGNPIFCDINPRSAHVMNRLLQFFDLTVCLDRAGPNGYVEVYEDPIVYRFSMSCFIQIVCTPNANSSAFHQTLLTNLKIHCETFFAHISPVQIPLLYRLIKVFLSICTDTFDWSILDCSANNTQTEKNDKENPNIQAGELNDEPSSTDVEKQSWASWVWSFVPSIIPVMEASDESDGEYTDSNLKEQYSDTDCVKELIRCILEDASEHEVVLPVPAIPDSTESPPLVPAVKTHDVSYVSDPHCSENTTSGNFQQEYEGTNKEKYSHLRRRKIRRLRRSASVVPVLVVGIFIDKIDLDISLPYPKGFTCSSSTSGVRRSHNVKRHFQHSRPGIKCEFIDIAFQTTVRDAYFNLVQFGVRGFNCFPIGCICCCGQSEYSANLKHDSVYNCSSDTSSLNTCTMYDDYLDKVRPNFLTLGCHANVKSSPSGLHSHPCEIFYSAILQQSNNQFTICSKTTHNLSKFNYSPILTLSDYDKYLTDENVQENYPAFWFDSVRSLQVDNPQVAASDLSSVHQYQMEGVRVFAHNRFLIGSYTIDVSPNLMHRLQGVIIAYKSSSPYPSCSISQTDEMSTMLSSNLSLANFSQHIPTCNTRFNISDGIICVHTSHNFQVNQTLPYLQLHIDRISLYNRSPIYPYNIVHIINRQTIPPYLFKRSYEFIQLELNNPLKSVDDWLNELHLGVPSTPNKEWNKQLISYCYNRTIIKLTGVCMKLIVNHQTKNIPLINNDILNDTLPILKFDTMECILWSLNYPHLWNSPLISHSECRLKLENVVEINISLQTVGILSFILSDLFHRLDHLKTYSQSQDRNVYWPAEHHYYLQSESQPKDKKCWIWTTKLSGVSKCRICFTKLVSVIQISLETNLLMYLYYPNEKQKICPMIERIAEKTSDSYENKIKPLFCFAVQFPYLHDTVSNAPITCHGYLTKVDWLITPELFEWFTLVSLPDVKYQTPHGHCCEYTSSAAESTAGIEFSQSTKKNQLLYDGLSLSSSEISSKGLIKANIIHSSLSTHCSPTHALVVGNKAQWKEVWKRLTYCKSILQNAKFQILFKPARIFTIISECPSTFSAFAEGRKLENLLLLSNTSHLIFGLPQLYLSNYYDLNKTGNDELSHEQLDDMILSNCSWSCSLHELPIFLPSENIDPAQSNFRWMFSATQMYLMIENSLIFADQLAVNFDLHSDQNFDDKILKGTLMSTNTMSSSTSPFVITLNATIKWDREPNYLSGRKYRIPNLQILSQAVKTVQFCYSGIHNIIVPKLSEFTRFINRNAKIQLSTATFVKSTMESTNQNKPTHINSPNSSICITEQSCVDSQTVLYKTNYNRHSNMKDYLSTISSFHSPYNIRNYANKSRNIDLENSSICKDQDNPFDIILCVQCSLPSANGEIMLTSCDQDAILQWTIENTQLCINLQKECCCVDFHVRYFDAVIQKTGSKIPLFTSLEKDIQPIRLLQPYFNKAHEVEFESQTVLPNPSMNQLYQSDKFLWFGENNVPLIPINARKRHRLNSDTNRGDDKSSIGENFVRIVFKRTCSQASTTSDYFSVSQSDLSLIDDVSCGGVVYLEDRLHVAVQPLDIVIIPEVISEISGFIDDCLANEGLCTNSLLSTSSSVRTDKIANISPMKPTLTVHSLPIINAEIDSFRIFYLLGGISKKKNISKHPNALMLSCDLIQAKQLTENFIDRPYFSNDFTLNQSFPIKQSIIENDKQLLILVNCIGIAAVPFDFMCHEKQAIDYHSFNSSVIAQNPAKDWNQAATYSDINDPLYGWSIVQPFNLSITLAPAIVKNHENSDMNIYGGYAMELCLMNNLLILADCELIKHFIQIISDSACSSSVTSNHMSQSLSSSRQSSYVNLFERLFFSSNNHSNNLFYTPSRLFIITRQILFLMWTTPHENHYSSEFIMQINQPHMIVNIAGENLNVSDCMEFSMDSFQVDCRRSGLKSSCTMCKSVVIYKFNPENCNKDPTVIVLPCIINKKISSDNKNNDLPICNSSIFWYSCPNRKHSDTDFMKPCLLVTCSRPSRFDYLSSVRESLPYQHNRFNIQISTVQDQFFSIRPVTISSVLHLCNFFHQLFERKPKNITGEMDCNEIKQCHHNNPCVNQSSSSSIARLVHILHFYFDKINIEINSIKIKLQFNDIIEQTINSSNVLELSIKQILTLIHLKIIQSEPNTSTYCWQKLSSLSLRYYDTNNLLDKMNSRKSIHYLIWPNINYQLGLSIDTKHCIHEVSINPNYYSFDKVYAYFQMDSGLYIHLPVCGYINEYIQMIIQQIMSIMKSIRMSNENVTTNISSIQHTAEYNNSCVHCSNNDPILCIDDLRNQEHFIFHSYTPTVPSSSDNIEQHQFEAYFSHPYWPWILNENNWKQSPLQAHPWPLPNQVILYNDLVNDKINIEDNNYLQKPQWLGITWMYNELRTPNYLKVFPVPLELVTSKLNDNNLPNELELQCYLQYWDPFCQYGGRFMTYSLFILSDSQINQYMLSKNNQQHTGSIPSSPISSEAVNSHCFHSNGQVIRSPSDVSFSDRDGSMHSSEPPTQPAAAVWRILVDLRQSTECQNVGGFELSRCSLSDLHFLYKSSLSPFKIINYPCNQSIQCDIGQISLLTADLNWSRLQQTVINKNLFCRLSKQKLNIVCKSLNIFISSDRLMSMILLNQRIKHCIDKFANILFQTDHFYHKSCRSSASDSTLSSNNSALGWTLINYSNQCMVLDQLPLVKYLSVDKTKQSSLEIEYSLNDLFHVFVKPRQSIYWRPIVFPGPISSSGHAFRIKLRIGITANHDGDYKILLWSHPVELPWPLLVHKQHNDILCALSLKWEETPLWTTVHFPELYLIVCASEPNGLPGKIILHSNVVVRNLLPVCLTCSLSTSTSNVEVKKRLATTGTTDKHLSNISNQHKTVNENSQSTQQLFEISTGPTMEFISTSANISPFYNTTLGCDLCIAFKVNNNNNNQLQENHTMWSDSLNFKIPLPDQLNSQTETSHRTLIQLTLNSENNLSTGSSIFYAIITVEYYTTSFITPPICIITVSPLFEILNCIPIPLRLESKAVSPQQTINTNSSSVEVISPALFNHENWLACQHDKSIDDLSSACLYVLAKPIQLAYHYNLLLTGTLPNGESVFSHPIRLSSHEILKKLATTYINYNNSILKHNNNKNNNPDEILITKSNQPNNSLPIISTLGMIPKFVFFNNSINDYLDYLRNDNQRKLMNSSFLQYSLRIVLRSQLLLINCTGIDLHLKLSCFNDDSSLHTDNNCDISFRDNECLVLSKTQRHFQLGVLLNNELFWSETITIHQLNSSNESIMNHRETKNIDDKHVDLFSWNNQSKYLSFTNSPSTININILIKNKMLCLTIELKPNNQLNDTIYDNNADDTMSKSNNFIITIKPRFYIHNWPADYFPVKFKPIIIPIQHNNHSISSSTLTEVIEISKRNNSDNNIPVLWWNLSHDIDKSLLNAELLYCMQIAIASIVPTQWSEVFPLHRLPNISHNVIHRNSFCSMPIFLSQVSIPIVSEGPVLNVYPNLFIATIEHKFTGQIMIEVIKNSILQNLNPFSLHIYNCTNSFVYSVELIDQLSSSSSSLKEHLSMIKLSNDSMKNILKKTFLNWYPHKIYANSQLSILPENLLELFYMDIVNHNYNIHDNNNHHQNVKDVCLNFFHPSQFSVLELNLGIQKKKKDNNDDGDADDVNPIQINLKELYSSMDKSNGLWQKQKILNDHLMIQLYYSMNEMSFGLIIQLMDNITNCNNPSTTTTTTTTNQLLLLSPTLSINNNSFQYLHKIQLTIHKFCTHLITIENRMIHNYAQTNKSLSNNTTSMYKLHELLPPRDEFIRLTMINLSLILINNSILKNNIIHLYDHHSIINKQVTVEMRLQHLQLDNWCHSWTNAYDFPVIVQTIPLRKPKTILKILFTSLSLSTLLLDKELFNIVSTISSPSTITALYLYPPNLDVYLEDSLIYDILGVFNNFAQILNKFYLSTNNNNNNLHNSSLKLIDQAYFLCKQLTIDSFRINLSLHAMLRLYLSCHSAPLNFTSFKLFNYENRNLNNDDNEDDHPHSNNLSGSLIYWNSMKYSLTMHYITQMLFRSGWLVGSLDLLGNVTGLLYSLINGLNDLIHLRASNEENSNTDDNNDDSNGDDENTITMITLSDTTNLFIYQENMNFSSLSTGANTFGPNKFSLKSNRNVGFLYRLTQGLSLLTRRTTGGLLLSISGMASSLARNLDYLSLDPHYEQHQDHIRRHYTPKGFGEGIQQGLSSLGLCLLSAIAGVADQPLQAIFKTMDNTTVPTDGIFNSSIDTHSTPNFLLTTLGGFGRGLVGVFTKPVAGAAELIAQTSKGLLHGTNNSIEMTIPSKYGEPYISSDMGLRVQYQNVDCMILYYWGSAALKYVQSNFPTCNYDNNEELSICSLFTTEIYYHNHVNDSIAESRIVNDTLIWISASFDPNIVYASVITDEIDNSYFSWFEHFPDKLLMRFIDNIIGVESKFLELIGSSASDKFLSINSHENSEKNMNDSLNNRPFDVSTNDSWTWIDHIQFTSSNDIHCLRSIIREFWVIGEKLKQSTHQNDTQLNSSSLQEQRTISDNNPVDSRSDLSSEDLFPSDRHNSRWKRVREYLIGISSTDPIHI